MSITFRRGLAVLSCVCRADGAEMRPVDVESVAHLNGIFAPIHEQISLKVVQGSIPRDLTGVYLRNSPNCRFPPLGSYTYPLGNTRSLPQRFLGTISA